MFTPICAKGVFTRAMNHLRVNTSLETRKYPFKDRCSRLLEVKETVVLPKNINLDNIAFFDKGDVTASFEAQATGYAGKNLVARWTVAGEEFEQVVDNNYNIVIPSRNIVEFTKIIDDNDDYMFGNLIPVNEEDVLKFASKDNDKCKVVYSWSLINESDPENIHICTPHSNSNKFEGNAKKFLMLLVKMAVQLNSNQGI